MHSSRRFAFGVLVASLLALVFVTSAFARVSPSDPDRTTGTTARIESRGTGIALPVGDVQNLDTGLFYATIQDALDDPATFDGHTIEVQASPHNEGIVTVSKQVTIQGGGGGATIVATASTATSGDARGWFLVTVPNVSFNNLTFDGQSGGGIVIWQAIRFKEAGASVDHCTFQNIKSLPAHYNGVGVVGFKNTSVTNCTFSNIGRLGVIYFSTDVTAGVVSGCTYTGKGAGDWLDYGVELGGGAVATLTNNNFTNCTGVALSDGSTSAGVLATTFFGPGTSATLTGNVLSGNTGAIAHGYDAADVATVTAHSNDLSGNDTFGVNNTSATVTTDASANWWGANDVATVSAYQLGSVDFTPWFDNGTDTDAAPGFQGDYATLHVDDDSPQTGAVARVQEGVNLVSGSTVLVGPGTYVEQVEIDKNLLLQGAGAGATTIQSPAVLTLSFTTSNVNKPVVFVHDADAVGIEALTVDGAGLGNANYRFVGVAYWNAGGHLTDAAVVRIEDTPFSGTQHGVGILADNNTGGPYALEIGGTTVTDFQKNAMALNGAGMTVNVHDCVATGAGATTVTAQNGIQVSFGAGGTIQDCAISEIDYTPSTFVASGVLVYATGSDVLVKDLKGANAVTNVQAPISWYDGSGTIDGLETVGGSQFGPIFIGNFTTSARAPLPESVGGRLARPAASLFDGGDGGVGARAPSGTNTAFAVEVLNSCLTGTDFAGSVGIYAYSGSGQPLAVNAHHNVIDNWDYGLVADGAAATLTANLNSVASNATAGYDNTLSGSAQNAENNWWNSASGPSGDGPGAGDAIAGLGAVDFDPWLIDGTSVSAGCGFSPTSTVTLASDNNPAGCGAKIDFTATVLPSDATGTVEFFDGAASLGVAPLVGNVATLSVSTLSGGYHLITAQYGGDGTYPGSTSDPLVQQVDCPPAGPTTAKVTPCDDLDWNPANLQGAGSVALTSTYPQSGYGSLEFNSTGAPDKADYERIHAGADLLATLSSLAVDLYRNASSTSAAHFAPAVRLFVDNGNATDRYSFLIWEPVYNGVPVFPTDSWNHFDLTKGNFWQRAFKTAGGGQTIEIYNRSLFDWLLPGTVTDGGGHVSNEVGPNARVLAYNIGIGSGWAGSFAGAADNFQIGFGGVDSLFNFEPQVPTSIAVDVSPPSPVFGDDVTITVTVTPGDATGTVELASQQATPVYAEDFEAGIGDGDGWDHGAGQYTPTRVPSGTNGITSYGGAFHAEVGQYALDADGGSAFTRWGGYNPVWPAAGYTTTIAIYLDCAYAAGAGDQRIDWSSAASKNDGTFLRDFVFNMGTEPTGFVVSAGNNAGRGSSFPANPGHDPIHITSSGWYVFKHRFYNQGGVLACDLSIIDSGGGVVHTWTLSNPADLIDTVVGGNRYGWFASNELPVLAIDDAARVQGSLASAPVVGGVATFDLGTLDCGSYEYLATFIGENCYLSSSSEKVAFDVGSASTTVSLVSDANPAKFGTKVTITASVSPATATGTVEFFDGATSLGTFPLVGGEASLSKADFSVGAHIITASYGGGGCYLGSLSDPLSQVIADQNCPDVTVLSPNGGEVLFVGAPTLIAWTAVDDIGVTSVDILLSRDNGATFTEVIASGLANTGSYNWVVTGPGSNVDATPVYDAYVRVVAHDAAANACSDDSDAPFSIFDLVTPTLILKFEAEPMAGGVALRWETGVRDAFVSLVVERADEEVGPYAAVDVEQQERGGVFTLIDRSVESGRTYFYRLLGTSRDGQTVTFGPLQATTEEVIRAFELSSVSPNPTPGMARIEYTVPRESQVRLSIVDIQGRVVTRLVDEVARPGRHQAVWSGQADAGRAPAGIYFVRFEAGGRVFTRRLSLMR